MVTIKGIFNEATVFTDNLDATSVDQIQLLCDQEFSAGEKICIMPDAHAGMGCVIGTAMTISDKAVPNMVGVDIGCGMEAVALVDAKCSLPELDRVVHNYIPAGFDIRSSKHGYTDESALKRLRCLDEINYKRAVHSVGTLGGGNHFIELARNGEGNLVLIVHTGSRNLGKQIAEIYQDAAFNDLKKKGIKISKQLAYAEGALLSDYLHDMEIAQNYADTNRRTIIDTIIEAMGFEEKPGNGERFTTVHNYIDMKAKILRKGAVSAKKGEKLLIPINMRDGSLVCVGKGNEAWNCSAPHGAGRIMSRTEAKKKLSMSDYKKSMQGIYSSTVNEKTLDEAAFAYKPLDEILRNIKDTVDVVDRLVPIYNFKAAE
ncbi:MAG: RtcB family protein [Defluviitaleaceae bacterium]|nr:RtcB family protein [Defluviitaleaceae bacterium]